MQAITGALRARVRPAAVLLAVAIALSVLFAGSAAASTAYSAASAQPHPIPWTGWHGRPIERPHKPVDRASLARVAFPAGWRAGAVRYGTGYHRPHGSRRVRDVQRRLMRLGYHTGPIDGLYGPLTRSAVQWFQIKHGLRPTGVVAATTLAALRDPKAPTQPHKAQAKNPLVPPAPQPRVSHNPKPKPASNATPAWLAPALLALLALMVGLGALTLARSVRKGPGRPARARAALEPGPAPVLGYVTSDDLRSAAPHEAAIRDACGHHGWTLARLVRDARTGQVRALGRPGLSYALEQLTEGRASRLVVHELAQLARSVVELRIVLGWFMRTGVALTALDVGLDTGTQEGRTAVRALLSVTESEQARVAARTRSGLAAARAARPSVLDRPELAGRIREMRSRGMTLQAIADSLNENGVPTVRGGARWRPSSVQTVLGYKRSGVERW